MKFLCYTLGDDSAGFPTPSQEMFDEIDKLIQSAFESGIMVATGGLALSATGTKIVNKGGRMTVTDGPFAETKEIVGGFALIDVPSKEDAVEWTKRFLAIAGEGETTIREYFGPDEQYPFAGAN